MAAATGQLSASPEAEVDAADGHDHALERTATDDRCDAHGLGDREGMGGPWRIPASRPTSPLNGISTIQPGVDADRGVDDDGPGASRDGQEVVDIELSDDPRPDVVRQDIGEAAHGDHGGAVVATIGGTAGEDLTSVFRTELHGRRGAILVGPEDGGLDIEHGGHDASSTCRSRKWVAQLMHGS